MRYWLLASLVTASSFAIVLWSVAAIEAVGLSPIVRRVHGATPSQRASMLFWLRLLPVGAAIAFSVALVLPTFLYYEPIHTDEPLTKTMVVVAALGVLVVQATIFRMARTWRATRELARRWKTSGRRIADLSAGLPTFAVDEPFPTVAVVGWMRPALFVSERVFSECTPEEIEAMVSHERAHIAARDNLRRLLLRGCPRLPSRVPLEALWSAAVEEAADARAAAADPHRRLDLASALVRLARLAPPPDLPAGVSAFYPGGSIEDRVRRLLEPAPPASPSHGFAFAALAAAALALAFIVSAPAIHSAMEAVVRLVP